MKIFLSSSATLFLALASTPSHSAVVFYNDATAFAAALQSANTESFDDSVLLPELSFASNTGNVNNGVFNDRVTPNGIPTVFSFSSGINAFGGNFDLSAGGAGMGIQLSLSTGEIISQEVLRTSTGGFFGFISDNLFTSVTLNTGTQMDCCAETYTLDNLTFGTQAVSSVPVPAAAWLFGSALMSFVGMSRRRKV